MERDLVGKLKETSNKHRVALSNLEKVIIDGHKYYKHSYSEKRALIEQRKFFLPSISRQADAYGEFEKPSLSMPMN